MSAQFEIN
jgi:hypothetical protein